MELHVVLAGCLSSDNEVRQQAEAALQALSKEPSLVRELTGVACGHPQAELRQIAAVLLRKAVATNWAKMAQEDRGTVKDALLQRMVQESDQSVARPLTHVTAVIAKHEVPTGDWPALLPALQQMTGSDAATLRERAMTLFSALTESVPEALAPHFDALQAVFVRGLQDGEAAVKVASLRALEGLLVLAAVDESKTAALQRMMPLVVEAFNSCIVAGHDVAVRAGVELLLGIIETPSPLMTRCLPQLVQATMRGVLAAQQLEQDTRAFCLQIIAWLAVYKPKQLAKVGHVVEVTKQLCLLAVPAEDEETFDADEPSFSTSVCRTLDQVALALLTKHVLPEVLAFVERSYAADTWPERSAAQRVLGTVVEGCADTLRRKLPSLIPVCLSGLGDSQAKVQTASAFCIMQMACHLQPELSDHSAELLPPLLHVVGDSSDSTTVEVAVSAVDNIIESLDGAELTAYLPTLMPNLLRFLEAGHKGMHDTVLSCVSSAAAAGQDAFRPYAERVLPLLERYMSLTNEDTVSARATATECAGLVIEVLGRDAARRLLPPFMAAAVAGFELPGPTLREYGHGLLSCAARTLKEDYVQYLRDSVDLAFASLAQTDGAFFDDEDDDEDEDDDDDVEEDGDGNHISVGQQRAVRVRTGVVDEKAAALCALGLYAEHTLSAFVPYIERSVKHIESLLGHMHADPRRQAVEALPKLVKAALAGFPPAGGPDAAALSSEVRSLLEIAVPLLVGVLRDDEERAVAASGCTALNELCEALPPGALTVAAPQFVECIANIFKGCSTCQSLSDEDDDDDDGFAEMLEVEEELVACAADALPNLAKAIRPEIFVEAWKMAIGEPFMSRAQPSQTDTLRGALTGTLGELVPVLGSRFCPFAQAALQPCLSDLKSEMSLNRHHAVFAIGQLMLHCGDALAPQTQSILAAIHPLLRDKNRAVIDNACGALARIAVARRGHLPLLELLPVLFGALPISQDFEEVAPVVDALGEVFTGPQGAELALLRGDAAAALVAGAVAASAPQDVRARAARALSALRSLDSAAVDSAIARLTPQQRAEIEAFVS